MRNGDKMPGDFFRWCGAPCLLPPTPPSIEPEREMTLVVALQGQHEIVMAADRLAHEDDPGGMYKFEVKKLRLVGDRWLAGFAGTQIGYELHKQIEREGFQPSSNIHEAVHEYAAQMRGLYEKRGYQGFTSAILAGVSNGEPGVYGWSLERDSQGRINFAGAVAAPHRIAIGAQHHGALYFANAFHTPEMDARQRVLLAYFCVREAAKYDPRVGGNVEAALITESGVKMFSQAELAEVERASKEIAAWLAGRFAAAGPPIPGL